MDHQSMISAVSMQAATVYFLSKMKRNKISLTCILEDFILVFVSYKWFCVNECMQQVRINLIPFVILLFFPLLLKTKDIDFESNKIYKHIVRS